LLITAAGLIFILRSAMMAYSASLNFDFLRFLNSIFYPILLSILLATIIWMKKYNWASSIIPLFCIAAMLLSPLLYTYKYFFRYPKIQERYDHLFYPFETFKGELKFNNTNEILVSAALDRSLAMLSDDPNDITGMANFFFDQRISRENVTIGYSRPGIQSALTKKRIDYALLSSEDWKSISDQSGIMAKYQAVTDPAGQIVLLMPR